MSLHELVKNTANSDAVRELVVMGTNVDEADKLKRTPLHMAAWVGNLEALQILVRANATLDAKAMDGFTALHFAAQSTSDGAPGCIRFLVKKNKALLNMRITKGNKSALHLAAAKGNMSAVETLLELGADVTAKTTNGQTALELAKTAEIKGILEEGIAAKSLQRKEHGQTLAGSTVIAEESVSKGEIDEIVTTIDERHHPNNTMVHMGPTVTSPSTEAGISRKRPISDVVAQDEI